MRFPASASSGAVIRSPLSASLRAFQIYGANTSVGKTVVSTVLCKTLLQPGSERGAGVWYLKPVSTGPAADADDLHVKRFAADVQTRCLWQFDAPVSPHLAAQAQSVTWDISDASLLSRLDRELGQISRTASSSSAPATVLVETAGGVHSPTPAGRSQADAFRPLRLPVVLVGDGRLGGISATVAAFEALHVRGYDVARLVLFAGAGFGNESYLGPYFGRLGIPTSVLPPLPPPPPRQGGDGSADAAAMREYYEAASSSAAAAELVADLATRHRQRIADVASMPGRAARTIWYPFTQHRRAASAAAIQAIDSACGDYFQTYSPPDTPPGPSPASAPVPESSAGPGLLQPRFDGTASWWTQGLGHAEPALALAAAHAAGRYGHVMFPGAIHAPALELAELLLARLRNARLARVFFSDNGSTGVEVAIKMALRAARLRYGWPARDPGPGIGIVGLRGAYHGDTLGAMDCAEPGPFNAQAEWYRGRGCWLNFPRVAMRRGVWCVDLPAEIAHHVGRTRLEFAELAHIFDLRAREAGSSGEDGVARGYAQYVRRQLEDAVGCHQRRFGALLLEPVVLGAAGMHFADPLFQRTLVNVVRDSAALFGSASGAAGGWTGLPVICDEVFAGLFRLGRFSASSFLQIEPDISVHAKLLTGGLLPLAVTLASESVFGAFLADDTPAALLHGHSYTAHPVGCTVAVTSLRAMIDMERRGRFASAVAEGVGPAEAAGTGPEGGGPGTGVWSCWSTPFVRELSALEPVDSVVALGTVLAVTLRAAKPGYASTAAAWLVQKLKTGVGSHAIADDDDDAERAVAIDARALGNVVYVMAGLATEPHTARRVERAIRHCFE